MNAILQRQNTIEEYQIPDRFRVSQKKRTSQNSYQSLCSRLEIFNRRIFIVAFAGFILSSSLYLLVSILDHALTISDTRFQDTLKNRQDLESLLSQSYSWAGLNNTANNLGLKQAKHIVKAEQPKSLSYMLTN